MWYQHREWALRVVCEIHKSKLTNFLLLDKREHTWGAKGNMTFDVNGSASWRNNTRVNWNHGSGVARFFPFSASNGVSSSIRPLMVLVVWKKKKWNEMTNDDRTNRHLCVRTEPSALPRDIFGNWDWLLTGYDGIGKSIPNMNEAGICCQDTLVIDRIMFYPAFASRPRTAGITTQPLG